MSSIVDCARINSYQELTSHAVEIKDEGWTQARRRARVPKATSALIAILGGARADLCETMTYRPDGSKAGGAPIVLLTFVTVSAIMLSYLIVCLT